MSETLTNGVIVPDKGSRDWYADLRSNWLKLDSLMAGGNITINPAQTEGVLVATITVGGKEYKLYQQDGDVSVKIDPSTENAEYPLVASTSAEANTGSVVMAPAVTMNPSTGAVTATSFKGKLEGNASTATNATKAVQDGAGAVIADTYATKKELGSKANDADVVHKTGDEVINGGKTFSNLIQARNSLSVFDGTNPHSFIDISRGWIEMSEPVNCYIDFKHEGSQDYLGRIGLGLSPDNIFYLETINGAPIKANGKNIVRSVNGVNANQAGNVNLTNILTDNNQIMVLKNLTGNEITSGAVIDCGTGNGLLAGWFIDEAGGWALDSNKKITGKWKNVSIYNIGSGHSAMFVKVG